ncbi:MAG TPA: AIPR family protein [Pseudolabrys sp.]|nr:AIPR family protein [Pseudolabrys sp.]
MSDEAVELFARELAAEVDDAVHSGTGSIYSEEEFTRIVLDRLGDEGAVENPILLWQEGHFARTKYKITGYSIPDDEERLLLVTTVHTGELPPRALTRDEILGAFQQAVKFYECSCKGLHTKIEPSNTDASELARRIYEARERISVLRVVLISDGLTGLKSVDIKEAFDGTRVIVDLFGIERLHRILGQGLRRDDIVVEFDTELGAPLPCLKASRSGDDYDAYLASIPGALLADIYEKYGTRLLELNVRAFLGLRGRKSVNAGLRATIRELPHRFLAYNNGIVATVDAMDIKDLGQGHVGIKSVRGLQIVNGGQTTASLHRAKRQDGANLDGIAVPAKIIRVGGADLDEMVAAVSRSANSQNTVQPADFSANDPFHVAVEKLANNTWLADGKGRWFYERARGSYGAAELKASFAAAQKRRFTHETPKERRFSKTDLAKYLNAWDGLPHQVSFGNQKNFQFFMQSLKDEHPDGFEPDVGWYKAFIAKAILFRTVQSIVRAQKFAAYQANIVAYTTAYLSWRTGARIDFDLIWSRQVISPELKTVLEKWVGGIDAALRKTAGSRMVSEWAKKVECRDALREISLDLPDALPPELSSQTAFAKSGNGRAPIRNDGLTRGDLELIDKCRAINAETWLRVAQWGTQSKKLHWKVAGIARTMGEYAIGGWERSPSAKQAKWAMEAYSAAEKEQVFADDKASR